MLALLLLAAIPAAAQARNVKVDGRVTGSPVAKGGAVSVPIVMSKRAGRAVKVGTRRVRVRIKRARIPVVGAAARVAPRTLRRGDRLWGVTSITKKSRRRMRYTARPTLKLKKVRVARGARRRNFPAPLVGLPMARSPEQILRDIGTRSTTLSDRIGRLSSFGEQVSRLQVLLLPVGMTGLTAALQSLTTAVEERAGTEPAFEPLLDELGALTPPADWLGTVTGAVGVSVRITRTVATIGDSVETLAASSALLASQGQMLRQMPGLVAQLTTIDEALARIEARLAAVEAGSEALNSGTGDVNSGMGSLTDAANELAGDAETGDLATVSAGVDALATDAAALTGAFAALQAAVDGLGPALDGLDADSATLETMVEGLEALGMGAG